MTKHYVALKKMHACYEGLADVAKHDTWQGWWDAAERPDWMLWALGKKAGPMGSDSHKIVVRIAVACAATALEYVKVDSRRAALQSTLDTVTAWLDGKATLHDVRKARAYAYAYAADAAAADAAYAAAYAAAAADAAADAYAAAYAAAAAADAAYAYARLKANRRISDIVRHYVPTAPEL